MLLMAIEVRYPVRFVHVFLDKARYHHAKLVQAWLARPGCRVKNALMPPIARTSIRSNGWGLMHRHITQNKCYATFREFSIAMLTFLRDEVPKDWNHYCAAL